MSAVRAALVSACLLRAATGGGSVILPQPPLQANESGIQALLEESERQAIERSLPVGAMATMSLSGATHSYTHAPS